MDIPAEFMSATINTFEANKRLADRAVEQVPDDKLHVALDENTNSVAVPRPTSTWRSRRSPAPRLRHPDGRWSATGLPRRPSRRSISAPVAVGALRTAAALKALRRRDADAIHDTIFEAVTTNTSTSDLQIQKVAAEEEII
jgi:hypothetical protein